MSRAAWFIIAQSLKQLKSLVMGKVQYFHVIEQHSTVKKNKYQNFQHIGKWKKLDSMEYIFYYSI